MNPLVKHDLPFWLMIFFIIAALFPLFFFYRMAKPRKPQKPGFNFLGVWLLLQLVLSMNEFYLKTDTMPPRVALLIVPAILWIIVLFTTTTGKHFIDSLDMQWLTWLHTVRIPVEITLYFLFVHGLVPELMTFEGRNWDILAGITAIPVAYFGYSRKTLSRTVLLAWNFICLALLFNIVINAILSVPGVFQQQAFDQPNIGVLYMPYTFLPSVIVPLVLFSHLVCIRRLLRKESPAPSSVS